MNDLSESAAPAGAVDPDDAEAVQFAESQHAAADGGAQAPGARDEPMAAAAEEEPPKKPQFETVEDFVAHFVIPFYIRDVAAARWCRQWWEHEEAASRLEALWQAYEGARSSTDAGAFSAWWRSEADHHMGVLYSDTGPFRGCNARADVHVAQTPQLFTLPPVGMFTSDPHESADQARRVS